MGSENPSTIGKVVKPGGKRGNGKVLRIGILQGGRIVEERLIRAGENVTVGDSVRNTFVLPSSHLPSQYKLFIARGSEYILAYREGMHGKVYINNTVVPLGELAGSVAARRGDAFWLSLTEKNRGKVQINGVTILFQFVDAPPEPRVAPVDFRPFGLRQMDWVFWGFFALSFVLNMVGYIYIQSQPAPAKFTLEDIPPRYTTVWFTEEPEPEDTDDGLTDTGGDDPGKDEPLVEPDPEPGDAAADGEPGPEEPRETAEERNQRIREQFNQAGLVIALGTTGETSSDDAVADLMGDPDNLAQNLDAALDNAGEVHRVAAFDAVPELRDGITDRHRDLGSVTDTTGIGSADVGDGVKDQADVQPDVRWDPPTTDPGVDPTGITGVVKKKKGQIKACYERELTGAPDTEGKVEVVIVITADGDVDSVWIVDNTTGSEELGSCILRRIRQWKFPATGDEYEVSYPFNLFKG